MLLYLFPRNGTRWARVSEKNATTLISGVILYSACAFGHFDLKTESILHQKLRIAFALLLRWWSQEICYFSLLFTFSVLSRVFLSLVLLQSQSLFIYAWDMDCWLLSLALEAAAAAAAAAIATALAWSDAPGDGVPGWWCAGFSNRKLCGNPKSWDHWIRGQ